jgi:hypothetical protein
MIGDVVAVQALWAGLKIGRRINITHAERVQIRDDLPRLRKREPPIELQPVGAGGNAGMLLFHSRKKTSNAQRLTSNTEIENPISAFGVFLHPFRHFDPEQI